jgi:hypothetical protein
VNILGIDPGTTHSGVVLYDPSTHTPITSGVIDNHDVRKIIADHHGQVAIEWIECYGAKVGQETFKTCLWVGRFVEIAGDYRTRLIARKVIAKYITGNRNGNDKSIRGSLIDLYGGKADAIGNVKKQGPLYRVKTHAWSALAVAITAAETKA